MLRKAIIAAALSAPAFAADAESFTHVSCKGGANEIRVTVVNVKQSAGLLTAELYRNDPQNFLRKAGREFRVRYAAHAPQTQFCLTAPAAGQFAVAVYHDRNANLKFDKNPFGLPAEPFGVSRNPAIRLAPPPIEEALIEVGETGAATEIRLKD
jgi:uncharacterized protein (DUF2141 family)